MAQQAKTGLLKAGALVASMAAAAFPAAAQDVTVAAEQDRSGWSEETRELAEASNAATEYARKNGVAILLHVGLDIQNHAESEALLAWVQQQFKEGFAKQGLEVGIFPRMNDAAGTGLVYHVGDTIYTPPRSERAVLDLQTASDLIPDVAEQTRISLELAELQPELAPQPGG